MFKIVGQTTDGKLVVSKVYLFFETHGIPLDVLFGLLLERGFLPSWEHFYREALSAGMKHERILAKLEEALADSYGPAFKDEVLQRLQKSMRGHNF